MRIDNSTYLQHIRVYRTPLYKATVQAALKTRWFKSKRSYAVMLSIVSKSQPVDWNKTATGQAFAWSLTIVPMPIWADVDAQL